MLKIKPYKQSAYYLCGPASLKMILSYYGVDKSEKIIAKQTSTTSKIGCAHQNLIKYAKKLGFKAYFKDNFSIKNLESLINKKIPVIIDWFSLKGEGHYSVIIGITDNKIIYIDPYDGKIMKIHKQDFLFRWFDFIGFPSKKSLVLRRVIVVYKEYKQL